MNVVERLVGRLSPAGGNSYFVRDPPSDEPEVRQVEQAGTNSACWRTEFGLICLQQPESQPQQASQADQYKASEAVTAPDRLRTEFGEVTLLSPSSNGKTDGNTDTARTVKTQFGQGRLLDSRQGQSAKTTEAQSADAKQDKPAQAPSARSTKHSAQPTQSLKTEFGEVRIPGQASPVGKAQQAAPRQTPDRAKQPIPAAPPNTPAAGMASPEHWDSPPLRETVTSVTKEVQGPAAQTRNREYQPICSSKTFTTITDQPCQKEIVEVIREHRFYEKTFLVETRPAGERELTDRQREEETGTRTVMGYATPGSGPCEMAPELVVSR